MLPTKDSVLKKCMLAAIMLLACTPFAQAQYVGVTFGFNYTSQTEILGPDTGTYNTPLYNPDPKNPDGTWDTWVRELGEAGVDFVAPNVRGAYQAGADIQIT